MRNSTDIAEFSPLTRESVAGLFDEIVGLSPIRAASRRKTHRWPFPGTVELWVPDEHGERHVLATCLNMSLDGVGIHADEELANGLELSIAIHEPQRTLFGKAIVRHCAESAGRYYIGMEFQYDEP